MIDHTNYTDPYTTVTPNIESRVMRAILATGRAGAVPHELPRAYSNPSRA